MDAALKFIADEGVEKSIVLQLRNGYDVAYVAELMQGYDDDIILETAEKETRILLTLDKDFGELVFRLGRIHTGIILCRLHGSSPKERALLISNVITLYGKELIHSFTVIQPKNIRIRKQQNYE